MVLKSELIFPEHISAFSDAEAMQKMGDYSVYYRCQPEATRESVSQLIRFLEFSAKKRESSFKQNSILTF